MAEADTLSTSSSTLSSGVAGLSDVPVMPDDGLTSSLADHDTDTELQAAAGRLDTALTLDADADIGSELTSQDNDSVGDMSTASSSLPEPPDSGDSDGDSFTSRPSEDGHDPVVSNGARAGSKKAPTEKDTKDVAGKKHTKDEGSGKKRKNPLRMLKKLTKFDKSKKKEEKDPSQFEQVRIDKLPQVFVAKYLGMREVRGFCGLHHVRQPVDEMVGNIQRNLEKQQQVELPLVYVVVSPKGLDVREHTLNKQKEGVPAGIVPIDFISYGVQDIKYWRVFTYIVVRELSSRSKVTECHAYLCDSSLSARKMALSLGAAFKIYSRGLKKDGKFHNFQVELRPPDELAEALTEQDCDA